MQAAFIAYSLGVECGLPPNELQDLVVAGALHDSGAVSLREKLATLAFEQSNPHEHAEVGWRLLAGFAPFARAAELIRFHHVPWNAGDGAVFSGEAVPASSYILHLADRVAVLINRQREILGQVSGIRKLIESRRDSLFCPSCVDGFQRLAECDGFWLDAGSPGVCVMLVRRVRLESFMLDMDTLAELGIVFARIVDFRSRFTATHSRGVSAGAEALGRLAGMSTADRRRLLVAGLLHDLGKPAVPAECLEKPAGLTPEEFNVMRSHSLYTHRCLEPIAGLDTIRMWASCHHERLDGTGYPFHYCAESLSLGARIMAVADVSTALTEDRPYRVGMPREGTTRIAQRMAKEGALDGDVVSLLIRSFDDVDDARVAAQAASLREYEYVVRG